MITSCTLDAGSMAARLDEWRSLMKAPSDEPGRSVTTVEIDGGIRLEFPRGIDVAKLARLVEAEQDCCRFFAFSITVDQRGVALEVRAGDEAIDVARALFGVPA